MFEQAGDRHEASHSRSMLAGLPENAILRPESRREPEGCPSGDLHLPVAVDRLTVAAHLRPVAGRRVRSDVARTRR
jgi:hypothetical protein